MDNNIISMKPGESDTTVSRSGTRPFGSLAIRLLLECRQVEMTGVCLCTALFWLNLAVVLQLLTVEILKSK